MCDFDFCWLCLIAWQSHGDATGGFYQCNLYDPVDVGKRSRITEGLLLPSPTVSSIFFSSAQTLVYQCGFFVYQRAAFFIT
jgi:hypothetical protein